MFSVSALAETAALVGDLTRASMLAALMDGRALTASELARVGGIAPQTASGHLARLSPAGLLATCRQGRHHYYRLASPEVAQMLESMMAVSHGTPDRPPPRGCHRPARRGDARRPHLLRSSRRNARRADRRRPRRTRPCRTVAEAGAVTDDRHCLLRRFRHRHHAGPRSGKRVFCRPASIGASAAACRRHLWRALATRCFALGWIRTHRGQPRRSVTPPASAGFAETFGVSRGRRIASPATEPRH